MMADFLATLAARSLGQLPSVMPRRASRFEGDVSSLLIDERDAIEMVEEERRPSDPAIRHDASTVSPAVERDEEDVLGSAPEDRESIGVLARSEPPSRLDIDERRSAERETGEPEPAQRAVERPFAPDIPPSLPDEPPIGPRVREVRDAVEAAPREQLGFRDTSSPVPEGRPQAAEEPVFPATEPDQATDFDPGEPAREAPPERGDPLRVPTAVIAPDRGEEPSRRVEPEPSPRVTVTIGRIEVKTPSPQPSPPVRPKPRAQPPRMSLDDYLRRQRGRR